jgi:hypothetical protein
MLLLFSLSSIGKYTISNFKENDIEFPNLMTLSCGDCEDMKDNSPTSPIQTSSHKRLSSSQQVHHYQSIEPLYNQQSDGHYDIHDCTENNKYRKRYDDRYDNNNLNQKNEMQEQDININRGYSRKRSNYDDENRDIEYNNIDITSSNDASYYNNFCNNLNNEEQSPLSKKRINIAICENI